MYGGTNGAQEKYYKSMTVSQKIKQNISIWQECLSVQIEKEKLCIHKM